ncbi:uncharacterized protein LOC134105355 [Pungitius pungitius]|uniref:uncharacterized protein LOC134105355 n=1 Tax=Pungitius pungitius TaxID=134920 RepID=UPI002E0E55BD
MSDSDSDPFRRRESPEPQPASSPASGRRKSARLTGRSGSATDERVIILTQLQERGVVPAPGLPLSQLRDLVKLTAGEERIDSSPPPAPGRKRTRKSGPKEATQAKRGNTTTRAKAPAATAGTSGSDDTVVSNNAVIATLQTLVNTMGTIEARLQHLSNRQPSPVNTLSADIHESRGPASGMGNQPSTSAQGETAQHSLASAVPDQTQVVISARTKGIPPPPLTPPISGRTWHIRKLEQLILYHHHQCLDSQRGGYSSAQHPGPCAFLRQDGVQAPNSVP